LNYLQEMEYKEIWAIKNKKQKTFFQEFISPQMISIEQLD
jgi:hypothetical protein